jgi:riboflavin synthase
MFTGIIEAVGRVVQRRVSGEVVALGVEAPTIVADVEPGDSVSVNGVCLTATASSGDVLHFDAVQETLRRTSLSDVPRGARVNIERALRLGDRLSGHFVQGHVDCVGAVVRAGGPPGKVTLSAEVPAEYAVDLVPKGSIAVDGVSLTVADASGPVFSVALVPFTLEHTCLGERRPGDRVNIEVDILSKIVGKRLAAMRGNTDLRAWLEEQP